LDTAKEEFSVFLDRIDFQRGEKRKEPRGEEGKSVTNVRDELVERMMGMMDDAGNGLFPVEATQVRAFTIGNV
jgi:hypothetical protein